MSNIDIEDAEETVPAIDLGIKFLSTADLEATVSERFGKDTAEHQLTIVKDDGQYRHLSVRRPGDSTYWFEVVTWPGVLVIRGDMGTYAFSRLTDMFEFFRSPASQINSMYWAEKLIAGDKAHSYSENAFRQCVAEQLAEWVSGRWSSYPEEKFPGLIAAVKDQVISRSSDETEARNALSSFWFEEHQFSDTWEWDFQAPTHRFLWCLHAIVHAIGLYDGHKPTENVVLAGDVL